MDLLIADQATQFKEMIDRGLSRLNTCVPGVVESFNPATQTCSVVPAIQMKVQIDGETSYVTLPTIINAPLIFPLASTAGFALTLPVRAGDPCIILFCQRAIDNWVAEGGISRPEEGVGVRHHDLTDALVMLAAAPSPDVLGAWEPAGIEIRNRAKTSRVTVRDLVVDVMVGATSIVVSAAGTITATAALAVINAPLTQINGDLVVAGGIAVTGAYGSSGGSIVTPGSIEATGNIISTAGDIKAGDISTRLHRHGGVATGSGTSGAAKV